MSPGTFEAALRAAGGAVFAVDEVMGGRVRNAFVSTRPPGHHAEVATPMGFCFFNNAAIAARHAQKAHGAERVAIMDFDVHHGNGTQHIFWDDPTVMYASTHQMPHYPGTGALSERGEHDQIVNAPLRSGDGGEAFREAMETAILPRLEAFAPDLVIISAGFDAHAAIRSATSTSSRPTSPGRRGSSWESRASTPTSASCRCWKAATTSRARALGRRACDGADGGVSRPPGSPLSRNRGEPWRSALRPPARLRRQASRNDWRRLATRAVPTKPSLIIAQVESSGASATGEFASMAMLGVVSNP